MSTTFECVKTYADIPLRFHGAKCPDGSDPVWDEGLQQNTCLIKERAYADSMKDAERRDKARNLAGDELDRLAKQRMTMFPGETYRQALAHAMADNPQLKAIYAKGE